MRSGKSSLLVVDDDHLSRNLLTAAFVKNGHDVHVLSEGNGVLDFLSKSNVDLIILDAELPGLSGFDVLEVIRRKHSKSRLPIVLVTPRDDNDTINRALEMGANDYLTKPINFQLAEARIRTLLGLKQAEEARRESDERYVLATVGSNDGIWDWDLRRAEVFYSVRWKHMLGFAIDEIGNQPEDWTERIHPDDRQRVMADMTAHIDAETSHFESEHRMLHRDGTYRWMLSRGVANRDADGRPFRIAGSQTDITEGKVADPLTGLPNRLLFTDRLGRLVERTQRRKNYSFGVMFLDIDRFKFVNDSFGHLIGDQLLVAFSRRLENCLRSSDTVSRPIDSHTLARLGGDEFTVLLDDVTSPAEAVRVGERIIQALKEPFGLSGHEITVEASIGIALSSAGYERPEDLIRDADTAMYRAKTMGRNRVEVFDSEMRASAVARIQIETEIRRGLEHKEFTPAFQLIVSIETGRICGFEALARWYHPTRGVIFPADFISIAEETGLIVELGHQVLWEACRQMRNWQERYSSGGPLIVSVNLSARQFMQADFTSQVKSIVDEIGMDPSTLKLEITEAMLMSDPETAMKGLTELAAIGVKLGIDDFGTAYSSFTHLNRLPLDTLKIDRAFVHGMEQDSEKLDIVRAMISVAHNLGLEVVAEGIERVEQIDLLRSLGCEYGQGYFFSTPLRATDAFNLLSADPMWVKLQRSLQAAGRTERV